MTGDIASLRLSRREHTSALVLNGPGVASLRLARAADTRALNTAFVADTVSGRYFNSRFSDRFRKRP